MVGGDRAPQMHRQLCCGEPIEKGYGWSWAWQQLLNLEPWEHPCVWGINIAPGLGGIGFGAGRRQRKLRQILWLVWKYFCCHSINLRHQITFREHWGTVTWQCVFLPGSHGEGSTAGGDVRPQLPPPTHSGRCFHRLESEVLKHFTFLLNLHLCISTEHCRFLLSSLFVHCWEWIISFRVLYSLSVGRQVLGSGSASFVWPVDFCGLELGPWWSICC